MQCLNMQRILPYGFADLHLHSNRIALVAADLILIKLQM